MEGKGLIDLTVRTRTLFGEGAIKSIPGELERMGLKRPLFVIDPGVMRMRSVKKMLSACSRGLDAGVFEYGIKGEPTYQYLDRAVKETGVRARKAPDSVIGIGGGSCIDLAKGLATLAKNKGASIGYRGFPKDIEPSLPVIAVPTTAGTGSELVYNAVFIDEDEKKKLGINTENNYPVLAVLDPELSVSCPRGVTISSGLDALVHTLESFVSVKANPMTRVFSKEAFRMIMRNLPRAVSKPDDMDARSGMMLGAYWAMAALSNSSSGPTGAMSYLLGAKYGVPHGLAGAVFIGKIARINHELGYYGYADLYAALPARRGNTPSTKAARSESVVSAVECLMERMKVPSGLFVFGVSKKDYNVFYEHATEIYKGAFAFNPVKIPKTKIKKMLDELFA